MKDKPSRLKAAVVQMRSTADVAKNLERAEALTREAAADGAKLIVLPECFSFLGNEEGKLAIAETLLTVGVPLGPIAQRFCDLAKSLEVDLVLGGFWESVPGESQLGAKVYNSCLYINSEGRLVDVYRKIHLFDVDLPDGTRLQESASVAPGERAVVVDADFGKVGLTICYDVRFSGLYEALAARGAQLIVVPAAFTLTTGKDHWHVLLRARAIETQTFVLAAAQWGHHHGDRRSYGHALIADPWGTVLAECPDGEGYVCAWLDFDAQKRIRTSLPALTHRRKFV